MFRFGFRAMGSPCELVLYAPDHDRAAAVAEAAMADVERLEGRYSRYRPDSLLSEINCVAMAGGAITVDDETSSLLDYAHACHQQSEGLFDITSGLLRKAWDFRSGRVPDQSELDGLLARVGWHRLVWEAPRLSFGKGMELDFGGIVKEYAADRVATLCMQRGLSHGFVNLGGDIRVMGPHPDGAAWQIGIQHPRRDAGEPIATVSLVRGAVASSGDYERCIERDGVRYSHVLDPFTGWPVGHLAAVTVVADFCVVAGSASTIAMLKGVEGPAWLERNAARFLWVTVEGECGGSLLGGIT